MARISEKAKYLSRYERALERSPYLGSRKANPFVWPDFRAERPQWQLIDYEAYAQEGFTENTLVYGAIMYKVRSMSQVQLRAYEGDIDHKKPLDAEHPLSKLISRPNPHQSQIEFQGQSTVYLNLAGNAFTLMVRPEKTGEGLPESMYSLRPDRVLIVPGKAKSGEGVLKGYLYVHEGRTAWAKWSDDQRRSALKDGSAFPILPEDMMHVKLPNPADPLEGMGYGLSPLSPGARNVDVDNSVTKFLKVFFDHGTMMQGLLKFDAPLEKEEIAKVKERWNEQYGGYDKWVEVGVLGDGGEYQRITPTFDEMGFATIDARNETRILGPFGVPPILIGTMIGLDRSTYSNYKEARTACWEDTLVPESMLFETEYQYYLQGDKGEFVAYYFGEVPALRKNIGELTESWARLVGSGVPKDEATRVVGLDMQALPDGMVTYMPMNLVPVGLNQGPGRKPPKPATDDSDMVDDEGQDGTPDAEEDERDKSFYIMKCSGCGGSLRPEVIPKIGGVDILPGHYRCNDCGALMVSNPKKAFAPMATSAIMLRELPKK